MPAVFRVLLFFMAIVLFALNGNIAIADPPASNALNAPASAMTAAGPTDPSYVISPGDVLSFSINEEPDYDQASITVRPDGSVTIRPAGKIQAAGKTVEGLSTELQTRLAAYIKNPEVYVNVQGFLHPKIYMLGAVAHPGLYKSITEKHVLNAEVQEQPQTQIELPHFTVSNAIITSGGVDFNADLANIEVTTPKGEHKKVNLRALLLQGDVSQDILLENGDVVNVPKVDMMPYNDEEFRLLTAAGIYPEAFPVRLLGEVEKPGLFYVSSDTPYLNTAIAMAGGFKRGAVKHALIIQRRTQQDNMAKLVANPAKVDLVLRPNDVIEVRDGKPYKVIRGAETLSKIMAPLWWINTLTRL